MASQNDGTVAAAYAIENPQAGPTPAILQLVHDQMYLLPHFQFNQEQAFPDSPLAVQQRFTRSGRGLVPVTADFDRAKNWLFEHGFQGAIIYDTQNGLQFPQISWSLIVDGGVAFCLVSTPPLVTEDGVTPQNDSSFTIQKFTPGLPEIRIAKGVANGDFTSINLSGQSLAGLSLTGAKFANSNLTGTDFTGSDLTGADFTGAILDNANLQGAVMAGANFTECDLTTTLFSNPPSFGTSIANMTKLVNAKIAYSTLALVWAFLDLTGATITGLLPGTDLTGLNAQGAILTGIDLAGMKLQSAVFDNAVMVSQSLVGADLRQASFQNTELTAAQMTNVNLEGAVLAGAQLGATDTLPGADLSFAYMPDANLQGAHLFQANLPSVHFYGNQALIDDADLEDVDLSDANLGSMNLSQAKLHGAVLDRANLIDAIARART